ncbi:MAG: hypothetical protein OXN16_02295 [Gammaproteobacteria bacterium]|nr:hypothetical protein [Gammaproteobacteria bacterium]
MPQLTFRDIGNQEAIIYHDGEAVGDLCRHRDPVTGAPFYLVCLTEDPRGQVRVDDRARIRDTITQRLTTHPLLGWRY